MIKYLSYMILVLSCDMYTSISCVGSFAQTSSNTDKISKSSVFSNEWTWLYHKVFTPQEQSRHDKQREIMLTKINVPLFSQLVFSWNAHRPQKGHFSFWVQVRDASTGIWGKWHRMIDWGDRVQRSYVSKPGGLSEYLHVRLEVSKGKADGFRIKVVPLDGGSLSLIHSLSVCLSDFARFSPEIVNDTHAQLPSLHIIGVPKQSQFMLDHHRKEGLCSPTSCSMLVGFLTNTMIEPTEFAHRAFDTGLDAYGSWPFNMAHAFEKSKGTIHFATARAPSFKDLYNKLAQGIPVAVSVRGPLEGAASAYSSGHLLVVIGWDRARQSVICHDPAFAFNHAVEQRYPLQSFLKAWERSHRLVYLAEPCSKP